MSRMAERETAVRLPFAADSCPCVEKLRAVVPLTVGIRDGGVQLVSRGGWVLHQLALVAQQQQRRQLVQQHGQAVGGGRGVDRLHGVAEVPQRAVRSAHVELGRKQRQQRLPRAR
jgi:hypothetical protein